MQIESNIGQGAGRANDDDIPEIGVGMLGYGFMGKAHSNGFRKVAYTFWPPPAVPKLVAICGRSGRGTAETARQFGYSKYYTDWRDIIRDDEIELFDNSGPNNIHADPCIAAAAAGKNILCEKPLGRNSIESRDIWDAAKRAGIRHMLAFNFRFVPAIALARKLVQDGVVGHVYHFRGQFLGNWFLDTKAPMVWRLNREAAGSGAVGDLGSHVIDLARFLVGEPASVSATKRTFTRERALLNEPSKMARVEVDDAFEAVVEFKNGAIGTLEASTVCSGRQMHLAFEIDGSKGSIRFNLERMNELEFCLADDEPKEVIGFRDAIVTKRNDPLYDRWFDHLSQHMFGYEGTIVNEVYHFLDCIVNRRDVAPHGATFEDGYRCAVVCDAILESCESKRSVEVDY